MNTRGRVFNGTKVFIALRTNIFDVEREHITLDYIGAFPTWDELLGKCNDWLRTFGGDTVQVTVNGFANWKTNLYYKVALICFDNHPELSYTKNWHITLEQSEKPFESVPLLTEETLSDECYELWVGYADRDGNKHWISYSELSKTLIPELAIPSH